MGTSDPRESRSRRTVWAARAVSGCGEDGPELRRWEEKRQGGRRARICEGGHPGEARICRLGGLRTEGCQGEQQKLKLHPGGSSRQQTKAERQA